LKQPIASCSTKATVFIFRFLLFNMKPLFIYSVFLFSTITIQGQTPGNTSPGTGTSNNQVVSPQDPVFTGTVPGIPPYSPNGNNRNPQGAGGTDMTDPNNNGSYEVNPDGKPRDNFQSNPPTAPSNTQQPGPNKNTLQANRAG
jgi:hypothetical protein